MSAGTAPLRVDAVTLHRIEMPLVRPFQTSFGRTVNRETFLVEARAGGLTGWGELTAHEAPVFSYEDNETALHVLRDFLVPHLSHREYIYTFPNPWRSSNYGAGGTLVTPPDQNTIDDLVVDTDAVTCP